MSLCVCLLKPYEIYIAGDSRVSIEINNQLFKKDDNFNKVTQIDDMVIFSGGYADISKTIIDKFKKQKERTVQSLRDIAKKEFEILFGKNTGSDMVVGMLIATYQGKPQLAYFDDKTNFDIRTINAVGNECIPVFLGVKCKQVQKNFDNSMVNINDFDILLNRYKTLYETVVCEEIGGTLTVFRLTRNKIEQKSCVLRDSRNINSYIGGKQICLIS